MMNFPVELEPDQQVGMDQISCSLNPPNSSSAFDDSTDFQLQHLHQLFGQAVLKLNIIQVVHPIVKVPNPKDYLMILDHGGGLKLLKLMLPKISL